MDDLLDDVPPEETRLIRVIDFETTGTQDDEGAEVIELGRIDVSGRTGQVDTLSAWGALAQPRGLIPAAVRAVHHITDRELEGQPLLGVLWQPFFAGCGPDDILAAHNAEFERFFHPGNGRAWIDTYKVAKAIWPDAPTHSNQGLRYWLRVDDMHPDFDPRLATPPHRALPDAYVTAHLLVEMLKHKTIDEMVEISLYPVLLKVMNFGKHKGMTFEDAPTDYLQWIRDKSELDVDTKFTAKHWLAKRRGGA